MKRWLLLLGIIAAPAMAAEPTQRIDPQADRVLKQMSDYLTSLHSFKVDTQTTDEFVTTDGEKLQYLADSQVAVRRPNRLRVDRVGPVANTVWRYDGKSISVYGNRTGYYAQTAAPPTLNAAVDTARIRYGIEAPAADLYIARPYEELIQEVQTGRYLGLEPCGDAKCHHLAFQGADTDWQIWVQDGPEPLPRRYVITTKDQQEKPQFTVALSHWQPNAPLDEATFAFAPPPGAQRIKLMPRQQYRSAR